MGTHEIELDASGQSPWTLDAYGAPTGDGAETFARLLAQACDRCAPDEEDGAHRLWAISAGARMDDGTSSHLGWNIQQIAEGREHPLAWLPYGTAEPHTSHLVLAVEARRKTDDGNWKDIRVFHVAGRDSSVRHFYREMGQTAGETGALRILPRPSTDSKDGSQKSWQGVEASMLRELLGAEQAWPCTTSELLERLALSAVCGQIPNIVSCGHSCEDDSSSAQQSAAAAVTGLSVIARLCDNLTSPINWTAPLDLATHQPLSEELDRQLADGHISSSIEKIARAGNALAKLDLAQVCALPGAARLSARMPDGQIMVRQQWHGLAPASIAGIIHERLEDADRYWQALHDNLGEDGSRAVRLVLAAAGWSEAPDTLSMLDGD